jgi:hypothetical protein
MPLGEQTPNSQIAFPPCAKLGTGRRSRIMQADQESCWLYLPGEQRQVGSTRTRLPRCAAPPPPPPSSHSVPSLLSLTALFAVCQLRGLAVMSPELEATATSLGNHQVSGLSTWSASRSRVCFLCTCQAACVLQAKALEQVGGVHDASGAFKYRIGWFGVSYIGGQRWNVSR